MNKHEWLMGIAEQVALKSPDLETKVGSILVKKETGALVATGFNGFARGAPDKLLPKTRPDKHKYVIHSEINLICNSARHGISMEGCLVYCTLSPCVNCMRALFQCGIDSVIIKEFYKDFNQIEEMLDIGIKISDIPGTKYKMLKYYPLIVINNQEQNNVD